MRKAFKFYRSYYDVLLEIPEKEQLSFLKALLEKQFLGIEPKLKGLANFAYVSQKHSIEAQIKGYEDKTGIPIQNASIEPPAQGATQPPIEPPTQQLEEKEKEEEKEEEKGKSAPIPKKCFFKDSLFFDKDKFKEALPGWSKDRLKHYYDVALSWSNEGNKKIDWIASVKNWNARDEKEGKLKFKEDGTVVNDYRKQSDAIGFL